MPKHMALTSVALQPLPPAGDDVNSIVLALRTLGSFDFQGNLDFQTIERFSRILKIYIYVWPCRV